MQCAPKSFGRFSSLRADVRIGLISTDPNTAYRPPNMAGVLLQYIFFFKYCTAQYSNTKSGIFRYTDTASIIITIYMYICARPCRPRGPGLPARARRAGWFSSHRAVLENLVGGGARLVVRTRPVAAAHAPAPGTQVA